MRVIEVVCMASFGVYLLAFILFVAGFAAPYWYEANSTPKLRTGLWRYCSGSDCDTIDLDKAEDWFRATVALEICGFIFALVAGLGAVFLPVTSGLQIVAGLLIIFGIAVLSAEINELEDDTPGLDIDLLWGFGLVTFAGVLFLLNGILLGIYSGYLGCYMDRVVPCGDRCCDGGGGWGRNYDQPKGYNPYPYGPRPSAAAIAYPPAQRRPSAYMASTQPRPSFPAIVSPSNGGYSTYPAPAGIGRYPRGGYPRGSAYPY